MSDERSEIHDHSAGITDIYHHPMLHQLFLREASRTLGYRAGVADHARDKIVLDLGCGTGIMGIFALQAGARKVYAVEESSTADLAEQMFASNGCGDRVTLLRGNSLTLSPPALADLIVFELFGDDPFDHNVLEYITDARERWLAPGGRLMPYRMEVLCVGLQTQGGPTSSRTWIEEARVFGERYGIEMAPYLDMLARNAAAIDDTARDAACFHRQRAHSHVESIRTAECLLHDIDFQTMDAAEVMAPKRHRLIMESDGAIDAVLVYFRLHIDERLRVSTSPFAARTSWGWWVRDLPQPVFARAGEAVDIIAEVATMSGRHQLRISLP